MAQLEPLPAMLNTFNNTMVKLSIIILLSNINMIFSKKISIVVPMKHKTMENQMKMEANT